MDLQKKNYMNILRTYTDTTIYLIP